MTWDNNKCNCTYATKTRHEAIRGGNHEYEMWLACRRQITLLTAYRSYNYLPSIRTWVIIYDPS